MSKTVIWQGSICHLKYLYHILKVGYTLKDFFFQTGFLCFMFQSVGPKSEIYNTAIDISLELLVEL